MGVKDVQFGVELFVRLLCVIYTYVKIFVNMKETGADLDGAGGEGVGFSLSPPCLKFHFHEKLWMTNFGYCIYQEYLRT